MKNILIIGAGVAGQMVVNEIRQKKNITSKYRLAGFLDDNPSVKMAVKLPVLGKIADAPSVIEKQGIDEVIIAIPSAGEEVIGRIVAALSQCGVAVKIVPGIYEIIEGKVRFNQIREIQPRDLLGREEVGFDQDQIRGYYRNKTVLVTGAGGSIGREIFLHLLKLPVKKAVAFGHGENSIHSLIVAVGKDKRFEYCIGDVKDREKLANAMKRYKPDIVFHAAAHKHLPLMEDHPDEAVLTNVMGSYFTAKTAVDAKVKRFVLVSTDKAVHPTSVMGATKRIAENIILSLNSLQKTTRFSVTRFGNVLGSRGSVIPVIEQQIANGGPITITHPDITRYFMSIPEAARLVIKSATLDKNGEVFELDMGKPVKILELAKNLLRLHGYGDREIPVVFTGLRKGEKMHEELSYNAEKLKPSRFAKLYLAENPEPKWGADEIEQKLGELVNAAGSFDQKTIRRALKKILPEYHGEMK